jgi:hypothetical protein
VGGLEEWFDDFTARMAVGVEAAAWLETPFDKTGLLAEGTERFREIGLQSTSPWGVAARCGFPASGSWRQLGALATLLGASRFLKHISCPGGLKATLLDDSSPGVAPDFLRFLHADLTERRKIEGSCQHQHQHPVHVLRKTPHLIPLNCTLIRNSFMVRGA